MDTTIQEIKDYYINRLGMKDDFLTFLEFRWKEYQQIMRNPWFMLNSLNDQEFEIYKDRLSTIYKISESQRSFDLKKDKKLFNSRREESKKFGLLCMATDNLRGEYWQNYRIEGYKVSSHGRIRYNGKLVPQIDRIDKTGYLVLDQNEFKRLYKGFKLEQTGSLPLCTYHMVAKAFLGEAPKDSDGNNYHIHHIFNNGYDISVGNLIYLSKNQHDYVEGRISKSALSS